MSMITGRVWRPDCKLKIANLLMVIEEGRSGGQGEDAGEGGAVEGVAFEAEAAAEGFGAVAHDLDAEFVGVGGGGFGFGRGVEGDDEVEFVLLFAEGNFDLFGAAFLDGVLDGFLGDVVDEAGAFEAGVAFGARGLNDAGDAEVGFEFGGEAGKAGFEAGGFGRGKKAAGGMELFHRFVEGIEEFAGVVAFGGLAAIEAFGNGFGEEGGAGEAARELVGNFDAELLVFARGHLGDDAFEFAALADFVFEGGGAELHQVVQVESQVADEVNEEADAAKDGEADEGIPDGGKLTGVMAAFDVPAGAVDDGDQGEDGANRSAAEPTADDDGHEIQNGEADFGAGEPVEEGDEGETDNAEDEREAGIFGDEAGSGNQA